MIIWIVEDDHLQSDWLKAILEENLVEVMIRQISTELGFRKALEHCRVHPPDLVILDIMLRWTDPAPEMVPAPPDIRESGFYRAGLRCERLLRQFTKTSEVPVILYTILEEGDLQQPDFGLDLQNLHQKTRYISKDTGAPELLAAIESALFKSDAT